MKKQPTSVRPCIGARCETTVPHTSHPRLSPQLGMPIGDVQRLPRYTAGEILEIRRGGRILLKWETVPESFGWIDLEFLQPAQPKLATATQPALF